MQFINPRTDFAFKRIFGSNKSKDVLISFLNALVYNGRTEIQSLEIIDPYLVPKIRGMKDTFVDVRAVLQSGTTVIIEMQVLNVEGFEKRILYNAAKAYSAQLPVGEDYSALNPVIALTITDFVMFELYPQHVSRYILKEKDLLMDYPIYDVELVFVELPKFTRALKELDTLADKWLYFLRYAKDVNAVPAILKKVKEINKAFATAQEANLTPKEFEIQERKELFIHDQRNAIVKAERQALTRGLEEGEKLGILVGIEQGEKNKTTNIAVNLLDVLDDAMISEKTGLSLKEVQELRGIHGQTETKRATKTQGTKQWHAKKSK
jgi:predicted transposase/invertase (TIGR01784 family)